MLDTGSKLKNVMVSIGQSKVYSISKLTFNSLATTMTFSIEQLGEIDNVVGKWCVARVPPELKSQIDHDYEIDGQAVTLFEVRPMWRGAPGELTRNPFVRFRQAKTTGIWKIYWRRQTGKWELYAPTPAAKNLTVALAIIEADHHGCFFG
jgi:hypothetical protein